MIDESLLDATEELLRADPRGLLRAVAAAGAHVRTAVRGAEESELTGLHPEGRPGAVLVAGTGPETRLVADLFDALAEDGLRVSRLRPTGALAAPGALTWPLPRWAGPLDLLLITSAEGTEPGLALLVEAAYRRGCAIVSVTPAGSPLAEATAHRRNLAIPYTPAPYQEPAGHPGAPGPGWALIAPLLLLGDRLGLFPADGAALHAVADSLDAVAERCGPTSRTHGNPAKTLAAEFGAALPLLWSEGPVARAAARHAAATLTGLAGRPTLTAALPEALTAHGALLGGNLASGAGDPDDFFRDRVDEPAPLQARVLLLRGPLPGTEEETAGAAAAARQLAFEQGAAFGRWSRSSS
ncbi:SIS domain-containing protein [Streptomyces hainanensis]|uniref:Mannose-6-phosphate isomerase n=1 Tax=Streptomyces hainanensis TaxID=402648 RepID=A0A4V2XZW4_9ACTN|nr:SIS domain-containing protein [Streptomyces hainanensis]TDC62345.1 mannose-6-phosphate isomerase [Streptomyces hainanensis]